MSETDNDDANLNRLREMAIRGREYRLEKDFEYFGMEGKLYLRPLTDAEFLPVMAFLEEKMDMDVEEAQQAIEEERDPDSGQIDATAFDRTFIARMAETAVLGIDTEQGIAKGESEDGLREILGVDEDGNLRDDEDAIGLSGGKTLDIAKDILEISSDSESAELFRRDGGSE